MWSTFTPPWLDDPVLPCDRDFECRGPKCWHFDDCDEPIKVVCDDSCNECPESGPLPGCLRWNATT